MKIFKYCILLLFAYTDNKAQSNFVTTVTPLLGLNPSPYIDRYYNRPFINIVNSGRTTLTVKLVGKIEGNNGLYWRTIPTYKPTAPIILQPGNNVIIANKAGLEFLASNNVETNLTQTRQNQLFSQGFLPQGTYRFCIRVIDIQRNTALSQDEPIGCSTINISYIKPPQVLSPMNMGAVIGQFPTFSWTTPIGNIGGSKIFYNLYIVKLKLGQNPNEALQNAVNYRIGTVLIKENLPNNIYIYSPSDIALEDGQVYSFQVIAKANNLFFENGGKSEVVTFTYRKMLLEPKRD